METMQREQELEPAFLRPGVQVGSWQVTGWRGRGSYGTVYRVERVGEGSAGPFALKLALHPGDERFEREAELLSRISHPHVPRLFDEGQWQHRDGAFPYLVMQWIEGVPLYTWAAQRNPTSRQVLTLLAQLARALEATDEAGGVHRDVKGDNVLVRLADGSAFLTDYGAGDVKGAVTLTQRALPPGTPAYRSPEAWAFERVFWRHPTAHYKASPCDDLFALGITAYRLVTDEYPESTCPGEPGAEVWREEGAGPRPPRVLNPRVCQELEALILRLLAVNPSERFGGQPREAAEALEQAARGAGPEADAPLFEWTRWVHGLRQRDPEVVRRSAQQDAAARAIPEQPDAVTRDLGPTWKRGGRGLGASLWLAVPVGGLTVLVLIVSSSRSPLPGVSHEVGQGESREERRDGGTVATGDSAVALPMKAGGPELQRPGFSLDLPKAALPGQRRSPCKPGFEVEIRGGCWIPHGDLKPPCNEETYAWEGRCYLPSYRVRRPTTSEESQSP